MESRAITIILGMLMGAGTLGCSSTDGPREEAEAPSGGLDGGGQIALGLAWDKQVFLQPLWQDGALTMSVVNQRPQPVEVEIAALSCPDDMGVADACRVDPAPPLARWQVPAGSAATFDGAPLLVGAAALAVKVDEERLGLIAPPRAPFGSESGAFVSNEGIDGQYPMELAADFASVPGLAFQARLALTHSGRLFFAPAAPLAPNVVVLTPHAARAQDPAIDGSGEEFYVDVPETASEQTPFHIELDFAMPVDAPPSSLFVLQAGELCVNAQGDVTSPSYDGCDSISRTQRILLPAP